jgi:hypothetical protein
MALTSLRCRRSLSLIGKSPSALWDVGPEFEAGRGRFHGLILGWEELGVKNSPGRWEEKCEAHGRTLPLPVLSVSRKHRFVVLIGERIVEPGLDDPLDGLLGSQADSTRTPVSHNPRRRRDALG